MRVSQIQKWCTKAKNEPVSFVYVKQIHNANHVQNVAEFDILFELGKFSLKISFVNSQMY